MGTRVNGVDLDAGTSGPALSSATPQPIGTATAGVSTDAARADHVHAGPIQLLAGVVTTVLGADTVAGYGYVDPAGLASLTLAAVGQVVSGVTGTLDLYDLTAADVTRGLRLFRKRLVVERVPKNAAAWQTVRYGQTGGGQGDYTADTAAAVVQLAVYGEIAFA